MNIKNLIVTLALCLCFVALSGCGPSDEEIEGTAAQNQQNLEDVANDPGAGAVNPDNEGPPPEEMD